MRRGVITASNDNDIFRRNWLFLNLEAARIKKCLKVIKHLTACLIYGHKRNLAATCETT